MDLILQINSFINGIVWGPVMLLLLVGTGVYLTVRCGCLQARKFGFIMRSTLGSLFRKTEKKAGGEPNLTPFQAVSTALAGTVGTGNIAGVTGAIFAGGPGAPLRTFFFTRGIFIFRFYTSRQSRRGDSAVAGLPRRAGVGGGRPSWKEE